KHSIKSQYRAALMMLRQAVEGCPDALWCDASYKNTVWNIAYHTLFYTHLYLSPSEEAFEAWELHRNHYHEFGAWPEPYSREQVLAYLTFCLGQVDVQVDACNLEASSGFSWLPFSRFELHLYNIRHIMLHTGELAERLGGKEAFAFEWIARQAD
ncbi:MAG: DinB family protein, partial [Chloroflexi bacterium]|nr:DinB family protein [Chloroflexota bacterium]